MSHCVIVSRPPGHLTKGQEQEQEGEVSRAFSKRSRGPPLAPSYGEPFTETSSFPLPRPPPLTQHFCGHRSLDLKPLPRKCSEVPNNLEFQIPMSFFLVCLDNTAVQAAECNATGLFLSARFFSVPPSPHFPPCRIPIGPPRLAHWLLLSEKKRPTRYRGNLLLLLGFNNASIRTRRQHLDPHTPHSSLAECLLASTKVAEHGREPGKERS